MRMIRAALVAACLCGAATSASASDPLEPHVLLGPEAAALAAGLANAGAGVGDAGATLTADVAVVLFEPAGLVRLVLIDTKARRKAWAVMPLDQFSGLLRGLGEGV